MTVSCPTTTKTIVRRQRECVEPQLVCLLIGVGQTNIESIESSKRIGARVAAYQVVYGVGSVTASFGFGRLFAIASSPFPNMAEDQHLIGLRENCINMQKLL